MYGYLVSNIFPLFVQCVIGEVANLGFLLVYYRLSTPDERRSVVRLCAITASALAVITVYVILATAGVTHESHREIEKIMGYIAVAINICMYGSPLEVMRSVIRAKSAAALPIVFSAMSFLNCALWVIFGIMDDDMFVLTPNAIATVLSAIQIGLYLKYPPHRGAVGTETQALVDLERSARDKESSVVVAVSPVLDASPTSTPHVQVATPNAGRV
jgi:solute carrier family 50 protein (sugar transporter)